MKILIFDYNEPILHILHREFLTLGHQSEVIQQKRFSLEVAESAFERVKPDFVLITNFDYSPFSEDPFGLDRLVSKYGVPAISWFFESPQLSGGSQGLAGWYRNEFHRNFHIVSGDSHYLDFFRSRGLTASYLPMGFDETTVTSSKQTWAPGDEANLFWSGACLSGGLDEVLSDVEMKDYFVYWTLTDIEKIKGQKLTSEFEQRIFSDLSKIFSLSHRFDRRFQMTRQEWTNRRLEWFSTEIEKIFWQVVGARVDLMFSWHQTTEALRVLNEKLPLLVHGSDEWNLMVQNLRTPALRLSREQLYAGYAQHFASLCLTKQTFWNFIHEKVWAIFANGGFPFADERGDLWKFFKKDEIAVYSERDEIPELYDYYLKNPHIREKMIGLGRQRVMRDHTYRRRAEQLVSIAEALKKGTVSSLVDETAMHFAQQ